ncbi:MAG TPA: LysR family transcriptional regulator, partial [Rhizobiales bacterium]|nr:LysR family transcriptional regulator [Hyphomicrobiales bacterium]
SGYDDLAGSLKFGVVGSVVAGILPEALSRLREAHPNLQTRVVCGLSADLVVQVDCGDIDVAIVSEPPSALAPNLVWTPVVDEPLVIITSQKNSQKRGHELLEENSFIRFNRKAWAGRLIDRVLRKYEIQVNETMELDSLEAISLMVGQGLGVSLVPQRPIKTPFPAELRIIPFKGGAHYRSVGMVTRTGSTCARLIEALYKNLVGTVAASRIK